MIGARIIKDSIANDIRLVSFELEMPKYLMAELNTHKILCRNAQSSRAVPVERTLEQVVKNPFIPDHWTQNKAGMQGVDNWNNYIRLGDRVYNREDFWKRSKSFAIEHARAYREAGYHKQLVNRILEPYMMTRVVFSGTEWDNFFNLRIHKDTDPHLRDLAIMMYQRMQESTPQELPISEWHLPYIITSKAGGGHFGYFHPHSGEALSLETARRISLSCIAQVSYRALDSSEDKAERIYDMLLPIGEPIHASCFEHIATPFITPYNAEEWQVGESHRDKHGWSWSGQLRGWCQYRKTIPNENCTIFTQAEFEKRIHDIRLTNMREADIL